MSAGQGGKKARKKGQTLSLGEFLGDEAKAQVVTTSSKSWADEMEQADIEETDYGAPKVIIDRAALPSAPRASRGANVDMSLVPNEPPYTAYVGNIPFEATQEDIERFFKGLKVVGVRIPAEAGRAKGFGYAEFEDRQSLLDALALNESTMRGRQIRVDLASHNQERERREGGGERGDRRRGFGDDDDDKTLGDWRRKEDRQQTDERYHGGGRERKDDYFRDRPMDRDGGRDRFGDRSDRGGDRDRRDGFRFGNNDRGGRFEDRGRFDDRNRYEDRGRFDDRDRDRGRFDSREPDDHGGKTSFGFRDKDRDWDRSDRYAPPRDRDRFERNGPGMHRDGDRDDRLRDRGRDGMDRHRDSDERPRFGGRDRFADRDRYRDGSDRDRPSREGGEWRDRRRDNGEHRDDEGRNREQDHGSDGGGRSDHDAHRSDAGRHHSTERSRDSSRERAPPADVPKERPRLKIQPRTKPLEDAGQTSASASSIFGGAKPVDTAAREREIEERLKKKPLEKEQHTPGEEDHSHPLRTSVSSADESKPEEPSRRHNSGGERLRKESSSSHDAPTKERLDSTHERQKERHSSNKGGSQKTSTSTDVAEGSDNEWSEVSRRPSKKSSAEKQPPAVPVKLVPAPPPKENIWEKRKTLQQQPPISVSTSLSDTKVDQSQTSPYQPPTSPGESVTNQIKEMSVQEEANTSTKSENLPSESKAEPVAATEAPAVNVWESRMKARSEKVGASASAAPTSPKQADTDTAQVQAAVSSTEARVERADVAPRPESGPTGTDTGPTYTDGRQTQGQVKSDNRQPARTESGPAQVPRKTATVSVAAVAAGRGSSGKRADADNRYAAAVSSNVSATAQPGARKREKALPQSIDDMPKLEQRSGKDWSNANKFSSLPTDDGNVDDQTVEDADD